VPKPRTPGGVRRMADRMAQSKRVRHVETNPSTGSLLISFDPEDPIDLLIEALRQIGLEVATLVEQTRQVRTQSSGAVVVQRAMSGANAKLHEMTQGHIDLRLAVPAVYTALAIRNFLTHRARLRDATWYQLLYWAFDSFFKLHEEQTVRESARSHGRVVN
jgi:Heavy metal associated domain 2